ncbi:MAG: TIGR02206 family membrane protein [Lachnospiraceae bacterium]|nr:TIGR02206 family membrane protein [Lachnospiraceae bacterium]
MKDFFIYFFGQGTEPEFALFTVAHFAPILLMILTIYLLHRFQEQIRNSKHEETLRFALAFALIIADMSYYWRLVGCPWLEPGPMENLPIGVCAWSVIFSSFMLAGKKQSLFDIVYFWLFSGSLFALLTPTPLTYTGPTRYRYYQFWAEHTLGYIAIFYMIFIHKMRPTFRSIIRSYIALVILAFIAYQVNVMIPGANYLYMARPEAAPSILDILPPNFALRITIMVAAITVMFGLAYLPWYLKDRRTKQNNA